MDMLDFESCGLYFDEPLNPETKRHLDCAAENYGEKLAEESLMQAYVLEPKHPMVLVALYRFYYYQHRLEDALRIAEGVLKIYAKRLELPENWQELSEMRLGNGVMISMTMMRFYMLALKGAGYLELRLGRYESARMRLQKVAELDSYDHLGARALLDVVRNALYEHTNPVPALS